MHLQSLPPELLSSLEGIKGFNKESFEKTHASGDQVTSIRLNPAKWNQVTGDVKRETSEEINSEFALPIIKNSWLISNASRFTSHDKVPWSSFGYYLPSRPSFTLDPFFHAGLYYVQEASGMFLEQALKQTLDLSHSVKILDLCAAPGGKSTLIQSLISRESLLVSNEVIKSRVGILQENIIKWGSSNVIITNNDPKDFSRLENYFDAIIIDAPCSGSGLFRRDPEAIGEWSKENVRLCSSRQQRILADAWPALKKNGILIYSTCSYSKEENEDVVDWMLEQFSVDSLRLVLGDRQTIPSDEESKSSWPIIESMSDKYNGYGYRFYPDQLKGEGFFISCFQKKDGAEFVNPRSKKQSLEKLSKNEAQQVMPFIRPDVPTGYFQYNDLIYAIPANLSADIICIRNALYLRKAGVLVGKLAGNELIPDHELALSTVLSKEVPAIALNEEEAIRYLRKEEIKIDSSLRGWALVQYEGQNLGWMKILHNRVNNYYPKEWRIRKT